MIYFVIIGKFFLEVLYFFLKLTPIKKNRIVFLSRQANSLTLDFNLIIKKLSKPYDIKYVCNRFEGKKDNKKILEFLMSTLKSMFYLATSKICIIDSYSLPVSILKHKKRLKIIQIWHAMGKIKQSGYQTLGKEAGRNPKLAKVLNMHKNYDYVIAGAKAWNFAYINSFGIDEKIIRNYGLPRAEYIYTNKEKIQKKLYKKYPKFKEKKVILYSPTFRTSNKGKFKELIKNIDFDKYIVIITSHPKQILNVNNPNIYNCRGENIFELLCIADYFITDYSSLAVEAAAINLKTYYYLYDYEEYIKVNGLNLDTMKEFPKLTFKNGDELIENLQEGKYDINSFKSYKDKYVPKDFSKSINKIVKLINENMK